MLFMNLNLKGPPMSKTIFTCTHKHLVWNAYFLFWKILQGVSHRSQEVMYYRSRLRYICQNFLNLFIKCWALQEKWLLAPSEQLLVKYFSIFPLFPILSLTPTTEEFCILNQWFLNLLSNQACQAAPILITPLELNLTEESRIADFWLGLLVFIIFEAQDNYEHISKRLVQNTCHQCVRGFTRDLQVPSGVIVEQINIFSTTTLLLFT